MMIKILMCEPTFYDIYYEINPWMHKQKQASKPLAQKQWQKLKEILMQSGASIELIEPEPGWPDMVFTANAGLIYKKQVILSDFKHRERQGEKPYFEAWFKAAGYEIIKFPTETFKFEGAGDGLFAGEVLFAGFGFRSNREYFEYLKNLGISIVFCELVEPHFYHLDTCFCPLNERQALWWPEAFSITSQLHMQKAIELFAVPKEEAAKFACNAVVLGQKIVIPAGCPKTTALLTNLGFEVYDCEMSEFIKAGGACKCLTLLLN